jgi:hypothetical protein
MGRARSDKDISKLLDIAYVDILVGLKSISLTLDINSKEYDIVQKALFKRYGFLIYDTGYNDGKKDASKGNT